MKLLSSLTCLVPLSGLSCGLSAAGAAPTPSVNPYHEELAPVEFLMNLSRFLRSVRSPAVMALMLGAAAPAWADVRLGTPFQDHAVLQRDRSVPVWGWADPGERVWVTLGNAAPVETAANAAGRWRVTLPAQPASATPVELVAEGRNRLVVRDVLVGEVWLCSGQSNMEFRLRTAATAKEDIASAEFPQIRQLKVARNPRTTRQEEAPASWVVCSPATAGEFSAAGFHFVRELWQSLRVPVGLINCSHGNSHVEGWMSVEALASEPEFTVVGDRWAEVMAKHPAALARYEVALKKWEADSAAARTPGQKAPTKPSPPVGPNHQQEPSALFNGMISPVVPYAVRGFLWYQGEGNARRAAEYEQLFGALIRQWRSDFNAPDAPFFWVQLPGLEKMPPTTTHADWIALREAQTATLALPHTGQAVTLDVGDPTDIHPTRKREVGERLARLARHRVYREAIADCGPELVRSVAQPGAVELTFAHAGDGLRLGGVAAQAFEIAGKDGQFVAVAAPEILEGGRLRLPVPAGLRPTVVRQAWRAFPTGWLLNSDGLPAVPFSRQLP